MTPENSNLRILHEVIMTVESLDKLLCEKLKDVRHYWQMTRVSDVGPRADVELWVPHDYILAVALKLAEHSGEWRYDEPLRFDIVTFSTRVFVTLHEFPEEES